MVYRRSKIKTGFTLVEILIVIALIVILALIVIVAINPAKNLAETRNMRRTTDVRSILDATYQYSVDHSGAFPTGVDNTWRQIGTATSGCQTGVGGSGVGATTNFADTSAANFNNGSYANTQYNAVSSLVDLSAAGKSVGSGSYTSAIKDAGMLASWSNITWTPTAPYGKELPSSNSAETAYVTGNSNMAGNVMLFHLNETGPTIIDYSGQNNGGTGSGISYGQVGKLNSAIQTSGTNSYVNVPNSASLNPTNAVTLESWVKWTIDPATGNQWSDIIDKNGDDGYQLQHSQLNNMFELAVRTTSNRLFVQSNTRPLMGVWYHVVGTWSNTSNQMRIYVNGQLEKTLALTGTINSSVSVVNVGRRTFADRNFTGMIDEAAIYNRELTAGEVADHYLRGALGLKFQVRSCGLSDCSDAPFIGPDSTGSSYYSELTSSSLLPQTYNLNIANNRYFQYKAYLDSDKSANTPSFSRVDINGNIIGELAAAECLDISGQLVPDYLPSMPFDPKIGSLSSTGYVIKKSGSGHIIVRSLGAELGSVIEQNH